MNFDPETKMKELFRKHMDLTENRPQAKSLPEGERVVTEADFEDQYYHQQEYFSWILEGGFLKFYGGLGMPRPILLGLFYGQDEKLKDIHKEFSEYLMETELYLRSKVVAAMQELMKYKIPCEKLYLPYFWAKLVAEKYLGMDVFSPEYSDGPVMAKVESPAQYGRFHTFSLD